MDRIEWMWLLTTLSALVAVVSAVGVVFHWAGGRTTPALICLGMAIGFGVLATFSYFKTD